MEIQRDACNVCGGTDTKLIDGYYYCIECGTQNTDVRETIIEEKTLGDGTFALTTRKRIVKLKKDGIEMSGEWYKWHAYNFIILGLADELISLGAIPTFKTKLLWIWTRYIKKYQNKSELIMNKTTHGSSDQTGLPSFMVEEDSVLEADKEPEATERLEEKSNSKRSKYDITEGSSRDIKFLSKGVILAMLYLALNLDESELQLSHLYRFIQEKHLNILNPKIFVPDDINVKKIPEWLNFLRSKLCTQYQLRALAMSLLKILNLGIPKVPDLKKIVGNFLTELCLPNDIKPLIYSLLHFRKCNFLDIENRAKKFLIRMPDYEGTVMTYILVAIKMCFGLDNNYEIKLSDIIDKINQEGDLQKSYKIGKFSESTDRLFSFREWCTYLQFRKVMLSKYNLRIAEKNCLDIDDNVYLEQMETRPTKNEELSDKISMEIISRLPQEHCRGVIPKDLFISTLTPFTEYTDIIIEYCQDPEVKLMLAEDFKRYSLKYACEHLELVDTDMKNAIKGVSLHSKEIESDIVLGTISIKKAKTNMVYVKNCENRNWLKTNRPTMEHVTCVNEINDINDKESDHGYDSENTSKENDIESLTDKSRNEQNALNGTMEIIDDNNSKEVNKLEIIKEEDEDINIFDDDFVELDLKEECEMNNSVNHDEYEVRDQMPDEDFDRRSDISDEPLIPPFNPETFDRENTIKELILFTCKKYKIPVPPEYITKEPRKRKTKIIGSEGTVKRSRKPQHEGKKTVKELLSNYYNNIESDFVTKVQQSMSLVIRNAELESGNLEQNSSLSYLNINVTERGSMSENHIEKTNTITSFVDENLEEHVNNKTSMHETEEINEISESKLFQDEEMILDDLIPKGDPEFDEEKYDANQLYVKIKEKDHHEVLNDMKVDPELDEILLKKINECENGVEVKQLQPKLNEDANKKKEDSDSEDDIPLSVIKEEAVLIEEMFREEDNYENLITKQNIPVYKYWIRHYDSNFMLRSRDSHTKFDEELKENTPISFFFVIQECASVLNCSKFYLYKNLQILEEYLVGRAKKLENNLQDRNLLPEDSE